MNLKPNTSEVTYDLNDEGKFVIENYNQSKTFSNFFPGIAGLMGIPMWVFYVNRGQCITSFGIEAKNKAIMEFQPANKSYRLTSLQGFRTFIKVKTAEKTVYWEPFQDYLQGTDFDKKQSLAIGAHDLTLTETNVDLGLEVQVNYFTLPEEPYSGLVRQVSIKNIGDKDYDIEMVDGLPAIVPYGLTDGLIKNISRTVEAWVQVLNLEAKAPYYQLKVEVADKPEVTLIKEGNFFFSMDMKDQKLLTPIVDAQCVFGPAYDFMAPVNFFNEDFVVPQKQQTSNRTPCAMSHHCFKLPVATHHGIVSVFGYADNEAQLNTIAEQFREAKFVERKARKNQEIIDEIRGFALTHSSSNAFNLYSSHTFLDNILRGGLPVSVKTKEGAVAFNVYSRKHGDLERDYNYFVVAPTFYSQGNGNYRDVNQNRRNDVWFNTDVKDQHLINFLNLVQADGYNPLVVKGTTFQVDDFKRLEEILKKCCQDGQEKLQIFLKESFFPGGLLKFLSDNKITLKKVAMDDFLGQVLSICQKQELAEHGEGFWSDHWTYNMDLVESYLALYPEQLRDLLLENKAFTFYHNTHYVLGRDQRYVLTNRGVRQYKSVVKDEGMPDVKDKDPRLKEKHGEGGVYTTTLACKLLCLIANKVATLDPSGIGVEMEADKPNWYDSLNGLPGLLGSSISESFEIKRYSSFLLESLRQLSLEDNDTIFIFEELADFVTGLTHLLSLESDPQAYWAKSNDIKEQYRKCTRHGIEGTEKGLSVLEVKNFLKVVITKIDAGVIAAKDSTGFLPTYFTHDVTKHASLEKHGTHSMPYVRPLDFKRHDLALFLEGYVHALRTVQDNPQEARALYAQVRESGLFDKKLKMYKVNADLSAESDEVGRTRIFPAGWLENQSVWAHMEYKFMLELLRCELFEEFYENFQNVLVPFMDPKQYGRSILENSSFMVSSAHEDVSLHGQGFVARLSGSTAEFLHMWLLMNIGKNPFTLNPEHGLILTLRPALPGWLFTKEAATIQCANLSTNNIELPENTYAFNLLGSTLVVYHNPKCGNTFGMDKVEIQEICITYPNRKTPTVIKSASIPNPHAQDIRDHKVTRVDVYLG